MRYTEILTEENANYESMVAGFKALFARHGIEVGSDKDHPLIELRSEIERAKRVFRRKDRVIWYLRLARVKLIQKIVWIEETKLRDRKTASMMFKSAAPERGELLLALDKIEAEALENYQRVMGHPYEDILLHQFSHFLSYTVRTPENPDIRSPEIDDIRWIKQSPEQLLSQLRDAEKQMIKREEQMDRFVTNQPKDKVLISFPDGFQWVMLNRSGCDEEGRAMGHCGNVGHSGKNILSLRKPLNTKKGAGRLKSYLTFILHTGGRIGEMKGRFNEKPAKELHPYIIALLRDKRIKGIDGGGYMAKNNFSLDDLTQAERDQLLAEKPQLAS